MSACGIWGRISGGVYYGLRLQGRATMLQRCKRSVRILPPTRTVRQRLLTLRASASSAKRSPCVSITRCRHALAAFFLALEILIAAPPETLTRALHSRSFFLDRASAMDTAMQSAAQTIKSFLKVASFLELCRCICVAFSNPDGKQTLFIPVDRRCRRKGVIFP